MKTLKYTSALLGLMLLFSTQILADTDRNMLVKRWKVVKHQKSNTALEISPTDFIQLSGDGKYEQTHNRFYTKGSWALNADEITINHNGEHVWTILMMTDSKMMLQKGEEEVMELEVIEMPAPVSKTTTPNLNYLCNGKWRPNQHLRGELVINYKPTDMITYFANGSFEQVMNGKYSTGVWSFNKEQTELTVDNTVWKVENLTALFFKITKADNPKEFMIFAKTR